MRDKNSVAHLDDMSNTNESERPQWAQRLDNASRQVGSASTPDDTPVRRSADRLHVMNFDQRRFAQGERGIYCLVDTVTGTIVGGLQLHLNNASAIRTLNDIANSATAINKNPLDFELRLIGIIDNDNVIAGTFQNIIVTGDQIATMIRTTDKGETR